MKIPEEILEKWKSLKEYGDIAELARKIEISEPPIYKAFKDGECSEDVFAAMSEFYKERETKRADLLKNA